MTESKNVSLGKEYSNNGERIQFYDSNILTFMIRVFPRIITRKVLLFNYINTMYVQHKWFYLQVIEGGGRGEGDWEPWKHLEHISLANNNNYPANILIIIINITLPHCLTVSRVAAPTTNTNTEGKHWQITSDGLGIPWLKTIRNIPVIIISTFNFYIEECCPIPMAIVICN